LPAITDYHEATEVAFSARILPDERPSEALGRTHQDESPTGDQIADVEEAVKLGSRDRLYSLIGYSFGQSPP